MQKHALAYSRALGLDAHAPAHLGTRVRSHDRSLTRARACGSGVPPLDEQGRPRDARAVCAVPELPAARDDLPRARDPASAFRRS
eukprot:6173069-Pleurochrysis_carterae.AAC.3